MVKSSWVMAQGSWLMTQGQEGQPSPRARFPIPHLAPARPWAPVAGPATLAMSRDLVDETEVPIFCHDGGRHPIQIRKTDFKISICLKTIQRKLCLRRIQRNTFRWSVGLDTKIIDILKPPQLMVIQETPRNVMN